MPPRNGRTRGILVLGSPVERLGRLVLWPRPFAAELLVLVVLTVTGTRALDEKTGAL